MFKARFPLLYVESFEEQRVIEGSRLSCAPGTSMYVVIACWSVDVAWWVGLPYTESGSCWPVSSVTVDHRRGGLRPAAAASAAAPPDVWPCSIFLSQLSPAAQTGHHRSRQPTPLAQQLDPFAHRQTWVQIHSSNLLNHTQAG